jgi:hypothetical protein
VANEKKKVDQPLDEEEHLDRGVFLHSSLGEPVKAADKLECPQWLGRRSPWPKDGGVKGKSDSKLGLVEGEWRAMGLGQIVVFGFRVARNILVIR